MKRGDATILRAFFRNGGRRCWVVRVTGRAREGADYPTTARSDLFALPGVAAAVNASGTLVPAVLQARSGCLATHGHMTQPPLTVAGELGEYVTGAFAALGGATAWFRAAL